MGLLSGKRALIIGLASNRSIAYGISQAFAREGAELAFTYQNEKLKGRVEKFAAEFGSDITFPLDVTSDQEIAALFEGLGSHWPKFDILVHSVAYAPADQLEGDYVQHINRDGFRIAHDISSYSLGALAQAALPYLNENASILTLTYLGGERVAPNYNVMGVAKASLEANVKYLAASLGPKKVRVNAISAGPIRTLAASGISGFKKMLDYHENVTPLRANTTTEQVGNAAVMLASDLASGITGENVHVDGGYHVMAMGNLD